MYSGFQVTGIRDRRIFLGTKIWQVFFGGSLIFRRDFWGIKKNRYCPGGCIVLRIKKRLTNVKQNTDSAYDSVA